MLPIFAGPPLHGLWLFGGRLAVLCKGRHTMAQTPDGEMQARYPPWQRADGCLGAIVQQRLPLIAKNLMAEVDVLKGSLWRQFTTACADRLWPLVPDAGSAQSMAVF